MAGSERTSARQGGTGALRQIIRQFLSTNPLVGSYADEQVQLGGAGITVVKLDI